MAKASEINAQRLAKIHPELREKAIKLIEAAAKENILLLVTQSLRTKEEQDALFAQGRTKPGNKVTNCAGMSGPHTWGTAFDICIYVDKDHDMVVDGNEINWSDPRYARVGAIGKSLGLKWGGDFKSLMDMPHFELSQFSIAALRKLYHDNFEGFKKTWK